MFNWLLNKRIIFKKQNKSGRDPSKFLRQRSLIIVKAEIFKMERNIFFILRSIASRRWTKQVGYFSIQGKAFVAALIFLSAWL